MKDPKIYDLNSKEQVSLALEFDVPDDQELAEVAQNIMAIARDNLTNDGFLDPAAFLLRENHVQLYRLQFRTEEEKRTAYAKVVEFAKRENANAVITLNDAYIGKPDDDPDSYYPGKLAAEGADEAIVLTLSGPGVPTWCLTQRYSRKEKTIEFGEITESHGTDMSLLPGWATDKPKIN
jgi:hypothetical protein